MIRYNSTSWFEIKGRGWVSSIDAPLPDGMWNPNDLVRQQVYIDGKPYMIAGVEAFKIGISPETPYTLPFGLLVTEYR